MNHVLYEQRQRKNKERNRFIQQTRPLRTLKLPNGSNRGIIDQKLLDGLSKMFKKRSLNKAKKEQLRKRLKTDDDDADQDGEGDVSVLQAIAKTQQKHKLLSTLPLTSGGTGRSATVATSTDAAGRDDQTQRQGDQDQPLSLLAQKHQQAMEDYIKSNINPGDSSGSQGVKDSELQPAESSTSDEAALYQELARQAAQQASSEKVTTNQSLSKTSVALDDDAGGSGGAVLVGGTGITEVTLPLQMRLDSASGKSSAVKKRSYPTSSAISSAAPPQAFQGNSSSSSKSSMKLLPSKMAATTRNTNNTTSSSQRDGALLSLSSSTQPRPSQNDTTEPSQSQSRMGFQMARGVGSSSTSQAHHGKNDSNRDPADQSSGGRRQPHGSSDDRVFQQFLSRHRDQNFK